MLIIISDYLTQAFCALGIYYTFLFVIESHDVGLTPLQRTAHRLRFRVWGLPARALPWAAW